MYITHVTFWNMTSLAVPEEFLPLKVVVGCVRIRGPQARLSVCDPGQTDRMDGS